VFRDSKLVLKWDLDHDKAMWRGSRQAACWP